MSKILSATNFPEQLSELHTVDFDIAQNRGYPILETTKRNKIRTELMEGLRETLANILEPEQIADVYMTNDGIAVEVQNDAVYTKVPDGNGSIVMVLDLTFKNLTYDAYEESIVYEEDQAAKAEKAARKVKSKAKTETASE